MAPSGTKLNTSCTPPASITRNESVRRLSPSFSAAIKCAAANTGHASAPPTFCGTPGKKYTSCKRSATRAALPSGVFVPSAAATSRNMAPARMAESVNKKSK